MKRSFDTELIRNTAFVQLPEEIIQRILQEVKQLVKKESNIFVKFLKERDVEKCLAILRSGIIEKLSFCYCGIDDNELEFLVEILISIVHSVGYQPVQNLDLSRNPLTTKGLSYLLASLSDMKIRKLKLNRMVNQEVMPVLFSCNLSPEVTHLSVRRNEIPSQVQLTQFIRCSSLTHLNLSNDLDIDDNFVEKMQSVISMHSLTHIGVHGTVSLNKLKKQSPRYIIRTVHLFSCFSRVKIQSIINLNF